MYIPRVWAVRNTIRTWTLISTLCTKLATFQLKIFLRSLKTSPNFYKYKQIKRNTSL